MVRGLQAPGAAVDAQLAAGRIRVLGRARPLDGDGALGDAEAPGSGAPPRRLPVTRASGRAAPGTQIRLRGASLLVTTCFLCRRIAAPSRSACLHNRRGRRQL